MYMFFSKSAIIADRPLWIVDSRRFFLICYFFCTAELNPNSAWLEVSTFLPDYALLLGSYTSADQLIIFPLFPGVHNSEKEKFGHENFQAPGTGQPAAVVFPLTCLGQSCPQKDSVLPAGAAAALGPWQAMPSSPTLCCHGPVGNHRGSNPFTTTSLNTLQCQPVQTSSQPWSLPWLAQEWPGHATTSVSSPLKEKGQRWVLIFDICKKSTL